MGVLELRDVSYTYQTQYQKVEALRNITASFDGGKVYAVVGKSGSGKTTLMEELTKRNQGFAIVKSVTTRKPRGVPEPNYRFVSPEEFENLKKDTEYYYQVRSAIGDILSEQSERVAVKSSGNTGSIEKNEQNGLIFCSTNSGFRILGLQGN